MGAEHAALEAAFTGALAEYLFISLVGGIGVANGKAVGMFRGMSSIRYNNVSLSFSKANAAVKGDRRATNVSARRLRAGSIRRSTRSPERTTSPLKSARS